MKAAVLYELKTPLKVEDVDLDRVPHDMILADFLEPESGNADGAFPHLAVPHEEPRSERFAFDLRPSRWIDQERKQVLLAGIETGGAVEAFLRRPKIDRELLHQVH